MVVVSTKLNMFKFLLIICFTVPLLGVYVYFDNRLSNDCERWRLLSTAYFLGDADSHETRTEVFFVGGEDLILAAKEIESKRELLKDGWLAYVPEPKANWIAPVSNDLVDYENPLNTRPRVANYYGTDIHHYLLLSGLFPKTLWDSYKDAIVFANKNSEIVCENVSRVYMANVMNLFASSLGDLFLLNSERTVYYINEEGENIITIHTLNDVRTKNESGVSKKFYQGHLKAVRGDRLISLLVQHDDFRELYSSLALSAIEL